MQDTLYAGRCHRARSPGQCHIVPATGDRLPCITDWQLGCHPYDADGRQTTRSCIGSAMRGTSQQGQQRVRYVASHPPYGNVAGSDGLWGTYKPLMAVSLQARCPRHPWLRMLETENGTFSCNGRVCAPRVGGARCTWSDMQLPGVRLADCMKLRPSPILAGCSAAAQGRLQAQTVG